MNKPLLVFALVLLAGYFLATFLVGQRAEREINALGAALQAQDDIRVTQFEYQRGFFGGTLAYDLSWEPQEAAAVLEALREAGALSEDSLRVRGDMHVRHGPWIGGGFGVAAADTSVALPDELRAALPQYPGESPMLRVAGRITFAGMLAADVRAVDYDGRITPAELGGSARLELKGLQAKLRVTPQLDRGAVELRMERGMVGISEGAESFELSVDGVYLDADGEEARPRLWLGTSGGGFGRVAVTMAEGAFVMNEARVAGNTWMEDERVHSTSTLTFGEATLAGQSLRGGEFLVAVRNLDAAALEELARLSEEFARAAETPDEREAEAAMERFVTQFERLLAGGPSFAIERMSLALQAPDDVTGRFELRVEGATELSAESMDALARALRGEVEFRLRLDAMRYVTRLVAAGQLGEDAAAAEIDRAAAALYDQALQNLRGLPFVVIGEEDVSVAAELSDGVLSAGGAEVMNVESILAGMLRGLVEAGEPGAMMGAGEMNAEAEPLYGRIALEFDFVPDPYAIDVLAGGADDLETLVGEGCVGLVNGARPDLVLSYAAGPNPLYIYASSEFDTTLAVLDPNGQWHCNDDALDRGLDPGIEFVDPAAGDYAIWVGTMEAAMVEAVLSISEFGML
ncbi:YdgA family protein [Thioalkalivibrio sp. XN279]|uniref:YdgA family protein n=1 Tax=Thioalkalivibrio sp. XN279 TaxID=2714953 RepID=UPI00140C611C|nr:DUF945 family protein [Thioalkalivibrio sp. XN279]NHA15413.1 YdgA family protein [Thioalkalivibrio sp. XN279]